MPKSLSRPASRSAVFKKGSGTRYVYETLREKILTLELRPGQHLEESMIVDMLKVSRTPVREALIRLGADRLVIQHSNRGAIVAPFDLSHLRQYYEALDITQRASARWAAERRTTKQLGSIEHHMLAFEDAASRRDSDDMMEANRDFHLAIAGAADNEFFYEASRHLYNQGLRLSRMALSYDVDPNTPLQSHIQTIIDEHRQLYQFIFEGKADEAEEISRIHTNASRGRVVKNLTWTNSDDIRV